MKQVILVLGMHRSATSAIAGCFTLLGAIAPRTQIGANYSNPKGHFESPVIARFNDRLLREFGSSWYDWRALDCHSLANETFDRYCAEAGAILFEEFGDAPVAVLKDPRICRLAPLWLKFLAAAGYETRIVMPVRHPLEVARSLQRRNGFSLETGLLLWMRYLVDVAHATRREHKVVIFASEFLKNSRWIVDFSLDYLRIALEGEAAGFEDFVDPAIYHGDLRSGAVASSAGPESLGAAGGVCLAMFDKIRAMATAGIALDMDFAAFATQVDQLIGLSFAPIGDIIAMNAEIAELKGQVSYLLDRVKTLRDRAEKSEGNARNYRERYIAAQESNRQLKQNARR